LYCAFIISAIRQAVPPWRSGKGAYGTFFCPLQLKFRNKVSHSHYSMVILPHMPPPCMRGFFCADFACFVSDQLLLDEMLCCALSESRESRVRSQHLTCPVDC
jgi:hypothetical protein